MTVRGTVRGGVVVLPAGVDLPEGAEVEVTLPVDRTEAPAKPTIWDKLGALGEWAETFPTDLPSDLSANHDHYLHGLPKRR